jgi:alpha-beta hydrolase superfamily lysophospholipase
VTQPPEATQHAFQVTTGQIQAPDGLLLHHAEWIAENAKGGVLIVHGFAEHLGRYTEFAEFLARSGWSVFAYDARGHGRSAGVRAYVDRFDEYLADLATVMPFARSRLGTKPFLFGHSMGGLIALHAAGDAPDGICGLVVSNPSTRNKMQIPPWKAAAAKVAAKVHPTLALPTGLSGAMVSRDPDEARAYDTDPLNIKQATARWYIEYLACQERLEKRVGDVAKVPMLALLGTGDGVIDSAFTRSLLGGVRGVDHTIRNYPDFLHELLHEPLADRERVFADVLAWLDSHSA